MVFFYPKTKYDFMIWGDTQVGDRTIRSRISLVVKNNYDVNFIVHLGDIVQNGDENKDWDDYFIDTFLLQDFSTYYSQGNHDISNTDNFLTYTKQDNYYYSFIEKNTLFICLDSNNISNEQTLWLESTLNSSKEKWIIIFFHHPFYSSSSDKTYKVNQWESLFIEYSVDVVLNGHIHLYEILEKNGIVYIQSSGGGGDIADIQEISQYSVICKEAYHFLMANIYEDKIQFDCYGLSNQLYDTYIIRK